jgi:hypothetical protein
MLHEASRAQEPPRFRTIDDHRARLATPRVMLTHMSGAMLPHLAEAEAKGYLTAHDGLIIDV